MTDTETRTRLLDAAERLFQERGYGAVSMADVAGAVGIRKASLYHHVPGGTEELFVEVSVRAFARHHEGLTAALRGSEGGLEAQLRAASRWFIAHAPLRLLATLQNDMPALSPENAQGFGARMVAGVWEPLRAVFIAAADRGEVRGDKPDAYVGAFLTLMDGVTYTGSQLNLDESMEETADDLIRMMVRGLAP